MNETQPYDFVSDLANRIEGWACIPKLQVERLVGPILAIFLEEIMNVLFKIPANSPDPIRLIAPEWPLKKDGNNSSENIDWLMIQPINKILYFIELKTATDSKDDLQRETYQKLVVRGKDNSAEFLISDIDSIKNGTKKRHKYDKLLELVMPYRNYFKEIYDIRIIYIVPSKLKDGLEEAGVQVFSLKELPECIPGEKQAVWSVLRAAFCAIDVPRLEYGKVRTSDNKGPVSLSKVALEIKARPKMNS